MIELYYNPRDPRYIFLTHDSRTTTIKTLGKDRKYHEKEVLEMAALEDHLNRIPDYQYMASFTGIPKPVVFLEKQRINDRVVYYCLTGLWYEIKTWCAEKKIVCRGIYNITDYDNPDKQRDQSIILTPFNMELDDFRTMVENWGLNCLNLGRLLVVKNTRHASIQNNYQKTTNPRKPQNPPYRT